MLITVRFLTVIGVLALTAGLLHGPVEAQSQDTKTPPESSEQDKQQESGDDRGEAGDQEAEEFDFSVFGDVNPYSPPAGASLKDLVEFLQSAPNKPRTIRNRQLFQEAVIETAERVLGEQEANKDQQTFALSALFEGLNGLKANGAEKAGQRLKELAKTYAQDDRPAIAREARLVALELQVEKWKSAGADKLDQKQAQQALEQITELLKQYDEVTERHLQIASDSIWLMNNLDDINTAAEQYVQLGGRLGDSQDLRVAGYGRKITRYGQQLALKLKPVAIKGTLLSGDQLDWSKYKGQVVVIDFWATWCGPCVREIPEMKKTYAKYHEKGLEILGVSVDEDGQALKEFVRENELPWPILFSDNRNQKLQDQFGIRGYPTYVVVGRNGKMVSKGARGPALVQLIEQELAKKD